MTYSVYQHWDPLRVCVVGRSYSPEFYSWIKSSKLRGLFERIAQETEEDYQQIIKTLEKFNVTVVRPNTPDMLVDEYLTGNQRIPGPVSMNPRDQMIMIGKKFFLFPYNNIVIKTSGRNIPSKGWDRTIYDQIKGADWPQEFTDFIHLPKWIQEEVKNLHTGVKFNPLGTDHDELAKNASMFNWWQPIVDQVKQAGNEIITNFSDSRLDLVPANGITRIGKDLYFGSDQRSEVHDMINQVSKKYFSKYRCHSVSTDGHIDGCFTPIKPGLIVSIKDIATYKDTFPDWEVVYLKGESWGKMNNFLELKKKNQGRWWIKDYENDDELIDFVETWLRDWTGYAEESVFDVNILVIDQKNIIVNGYNKQAFEAFDRHGITAHICPVRHRYFWDGGVHCITADLHRDGHMQDYFPERNNND
jgi:N-dimethylarginine dimethylaminohydrolase